MKHTLIAIGIAFLLSRPLIGLTPDVVVDCYKAFAHCYVGGLIGGWMALRWATVRRCDAERRQLIGGAVLLTVVEVVVFVWERLP